jgi:hypothetical protein
MPSATDCLVIGSCGTSLFTRGQNCQVHFTYTLRLIRVENMLLLLASK